MGESLMQIPINMRTLGSTFTVQENSRSQLLNLEVSQAKKCFPIATRARLYDHRDHIIVQNVGFVLRFTIITVHGLATAWVVETQGISYYF